MKTPPLLLGTTLIFWGWQADYLAAGMLMAVVLESAHLLKLRWEFSEEDFGRIWTLCALLFLAAFTYVFTSGPGAGRWLDLLEASSGSAARRAVGDSSARAAATFIRWLPMMFYLFRAAEPWSTR